MINGISAFLLLYGLMLGGLPTAGNGVQSPDDSTQISIILEDGDELPLDPDVRIGRLDNGLTYYVRRNQKPEDRAELRLVVNAGSVLEDDDQLGLAHFAEHMAFNGTQKYEKQELVDIIEGMGMRFGPDLNAYTSFDETVYMLQVPTNEPVKLQTGLDILYEWAANVSFEEEEIDRERGVVVEEWRLGRGASARIRDKQFPVLYKGSRYAERLPIGKVEIIESFPYDAVRRFYRDWYRPDLMAVVAVGDFNPAEVENSIRQLFSSLSPLQNPRERGTFDIPDHDETRISLVTDPEASYSTVGIIYKHPERPFKTTSDYRERLLDRLYNGMLNARLGELTQSTDPPFIYAYSGQGSFARGKEFYNLQAMVREGNVLRAIEAVLVEAERVKRHGFTPTEFERIKADYLRSMERAYFERDKTESRVFASEYVDHFLTGEPVPGVAFEYALTRQLLPTITLDEVNQLAGKWITEANRVVLVEGPENADFKLPSESEILAVFDEVRERDVEPYEDRVSDEPLLSDLPEMGEIVEETTNEALGVTRLKLSNGVQVVLKPTDFKNDEILFGAWSPGGVSLVTDELYPAVRFASSLIGQSGVGVFGPIELDKKLAGKTINLNPTIGSYSEGFSGMASPADVETLLQLVYLYVTSPRADPIAYESTKKRLADYLRSAQADPEAAYRDTLSVTLNQYHPRRKPVTSDTVEEMDLDKSLEVFIDRFSDASDFTFYFVGRFEVDQLKPLVRQYLGSLPATYRNESWRDEGVRPPKGIVRKQVYRGLEEKSRVDLVFSGPFEMTRENRLRLNALADVFRIKLREVLREDMGGTYGVSVSVQRSHIPVESYSFNIGFGTDPERVDEMISTVFAQIDSLKQSGIPESYIAKVREADLRQHEVNLKNNRYWLGSLMAYDEWGEDPTPVLEGPGEFLERLTTEVIRDAARQYLDTTNYVEAVLYPERYRAE